MSDGPKVEELRREYGNLELSFNNASQDPFMQFNNWFQDVLRYEEHDASAMVLSTTDEQGYPDSRVVLLKGIEKDAFVFYTNYESTKARQLALNKHCALNFFWPKLARQVRVRGVVEKTTAEQSDTYFYSRPITSQVAAVISKQSSTITGRTSLEKVFAEALDLYQQKPVPRPVFWGGYRVIALEMEFWQGRDNRLHDRLHYVKQNNDWIINCLAP